MTKKEWYKDRLLWKANQFKSLSETRLNDEERDNFADKLHKEYVNSDDEIIFLFFENNKKRWTAITTDKVISYHNNSIYQLKLDSIEKLIDIRKEGISDDDLKYDSNFLFIGHEKLPIWTPNSKILFALMNILRMFPLRENT
ncbi:hypothetical protein [Gilliamella sp. wkB308]|uniref:hypothetical protein n=1 Tax=Gilliamella sp. wkB308 TaxID=3120263 RepID=UPI00080E205D|nr:hypothetical protein [Gilliamella apicola]OCF94211.1 hypothetical protein A9G10_02655 [Gilliamella apicola]